jgi:hypothetical protein
MTGIGHSNLSMEIPCKRHEGQGGWHLICATTLIQKERGTSSGSSGMALAKWADGRVKQMGQMSLEQ